MADILLLYLEGPLQSWGLRARWDVRDTGDEPSKSGIIGLLGCALGYPVGDSRLVDLDDQLQMGVRVERPGTRLVDFQTVSGIMRTADGGLKGTPDDPNTIISPRTYLQDAAFLVALTGPASVLQRCAAAVQSPRWPMYLGRKACIPTRPIFQELTDRYASIMEAFRSYPWETRDDKDHPKRLRFVLEDEHGDRLRPDRLRINRARMYGQRSVRVGSVPFPGPKSTSNASK